MAEEATGRARSCLYGLASVTMFCALALATSVALAQDPGPRRWDREAASGLLAYVERLDSHGLEPRDYAPDVLEQAIASGDPQLLERRATATFGLVAQDLAMGHVRPGRRGRYHIASDTLDPKRVALLIDSAIAARNIPSALNALAPQRSEYAALRAALARLGPEQAEERRKIEVNLERWRWLPRHLGTRHLMVNIPEYRVHLTDNGDEQVSNRVIVGKPQTATPQFSAQVTAVILNPSWHVPQSIIAESVGRLVRTNPATARARGYTWAIDKFGKLQVTQRPGPQNALGQMKLEMANSFSVYLHDTPNKELFDRAVRTFSHGCVRTDKPLDFAVTLIESPEWNRATIDAGVAARQTRRVPLTAPVPIYIVYMTAIARADGTVQYYDDPYELDAAIAAQLDDGA